MDYLAIIIVSLFLTHFIYMFVFELNRLKTKMYSNIYYDDFRISLQKDNNVLFITTFKNGNYFKAHYNGFYLSYDKESDSVFVNKRPTKNSIIHVDYFLDKINRIRDSSDSITVKYLYDYS